MTELEEFGRVLMHEVRDGAIQELFDQLVDRNVGPLPQELLRKTSSDDDSAIRQSIIESVDNAIAGFLFLMHGSVSQKDVEFAMFGSSKTNLASLSDGIHTEPFGTKGWIERYSAFREKF
jgi:hypothetical protein